ncbi:phage specificity protein, partial [Limosilactobacillus reuteri]
VAIKANSVDVTRDIKSAVDNVQIGGVNLVENGDANANDAFPWPHTQFQNHTFYHSGTKKMFNLHTASKNELVADNVKWFPIEAGQQYTLSFKGFMSWNAVSYDVWLLGKKIGVDERWTNSFPIISGQRLSNGHCETITKTFTAPSDWNNFEAYLRFDNNGSSDGNDSVFFFNEVKLEKGNKATSYSPAPGDTSKEIKSAKDAAIQVASDQINFRVNELSTQFDDKLNKRVNEVKTASEKFTSDGIEQVVTKVTEVKNDVDKVSNSLSNLDQQVKNNNGGGINLLKATDFANTDMDTLRKYWGSSFTIRDDVALQVDGLALKSGSDDAAQVVQVDPDTDYTLSFEVHNNAVADGGNWNKIQTFLWEFQDAQLTKTTKNYQDHARSVVNTNKRKDNVYTIHTQPDCHYIIVIFRANPKVLFSFVKPKLERGNTATPWTVSPEDTAQLISDTNKRMDTQTLDSANIDDLKTQGHYFVRNLTGNPIGGWVYVDVIGNNNDRIRQDVYQDNGGKHMYRRWFGNYWTGWDGAASQNDLNSVKTEVTASVKNLGDRVTTQVNSVETKVTNVNDKVDNLSIGGRNLLKGTRDFNSKYWYQSGDSTFLEDNPVDSSVKEIHSYGDWASFRYKQTIQLDPNKNYMISADIAIYDGDGNGLYVTPYGTVDGQESNLAGTDVNLAGFPRQVKGEGFRRIYLPMTQHGRTLKDFRIEGHGNWSAGKGSVFISKIALYEGNTKMAWSDSSDDFVEAIREVNTKWDVANGQIQGKVTETDVNNILNGKGYATQSWAQTMFTMKSDAITLQAVRDNITNGIQNQVNDVKNDVNQLDNNIRNIGTRNLLHDTSNQWRTLTNDGDWLQKTTASSCWTSTSDYHGGNKFTYAAKITNNSHQQAELEIWLCDQNKNLINGQAFHAPIPKGANAYNVNVTFPITTGTWYIRTWIIFTGGHAPKGDSVQVKEERLVEGATPGSWAPNPDDIQIGGRNLAEKTNQGTINWTCDPGNGATSISEVNINGVRGVRFTQTKKSTSWWVISYALDLNKFKPNTYYTISFDIRTSSDNYNNGVMLNIARGDSGESYLANTNFRTYFKGNQLAHVTCTSRSYGSLSKNGQAFYLNSAGLGSCDWIDVINLKIEVGTKATDWTPAPEDINEKIDTQTLDSANIDQMKTQGHYFVRNLTGNPIGGWVYVDVTGNNNDRLKQEVYQDNGYEHRSRRWYGSYWTEWTTDVNNKNVVSQINITPDQIKIASNKIVIDGNTDIHGVLRVPEVRLQGKSGMIGLDGNKGIIISSAETLFQTRITKLGMDFLTTTNGQKEIIGGITTGFSTNNENLNGISIVLDTQQKLGYPYGGDFFSIGNTTSIVNDDNRSWKRAMDYDASGQLHQGGFMWYEKSYLTGEGQNIYVGGVRGNGNSANDPLMIGTTKFSASAQPDKYQPIISLGYAGGSASNAGIGFLWDQMKPYGSWDISDVGDIWFNGIKFRFAWVHHGAMWNNQQQPAFYRVGDDGSVTSGIAFASGSTWDVGSGAWNITQAMINLKNRGML